MTPILEARNIFRHDRAGKPLLENMSLTLSAGERVGLTGPTGSGKTLLMRALALLDPISAGEILWHGKPIADEDVPRFRRSAIYLHQQSAFVEGTVRENLRLPFEFRLSTSATLDDNSIRDSLQLIGRAETFLDRAVDVLSGGERQVVALLRAVQLKPELLLLDEPTTGLDEASASAFVRILEDWWGQTQSCRTLLLVSHNSHLLERVTEHRLRIEEMV